MHQFLNIKKSCAYLCRLLGSHQNAGLFGVVVAGLGNGTYRALADGHEFVNMSSYSYLGLDTHPQTGQGRGRRRAR